MSFPPNPNFQIGLVFGGKVIIETTHKDIEAEDILKSYHTLTRVEAAFRSLKTELGLRPVFHQKGPRCKAHLFISVLAYHLLNTIELALLEKGEHKRWSTIREELSTHIRSTVIMTDSDKAIHHIRVSSSPEPHQKRVYDMLGIKDPLGKCTLSSEKVVGTKNWGLRLPKASVYAGWYEIIQKVSISLSFFPTIRSFDFLNLPDKLQAILKSFFPFKP